MRAGFRPFSRNPRRRRRARRSFAYLIAALAFLAAGAFLSTGGLPGATADPADLTGTFSCTVASITDGDTFRCAETDTAGRQLRIRLSGVAARERDGRCADGHPCPAASAQAATAELRRLAEGETLTCRSNGTTYGRIAAFCRRRDGTDLSCAMVESRTALRWERYWGDHRCP